MRMSIPLVAIVLIGTLSLSFSLAVRMKELASQDRLSFGDLSWIEPLAK